MRALSFSIAIGALTLGVACGGGNGAAGGGASGGPQTNACQPEDCGPRPGTPTGPCPDGVSLSGPACERDSNGRCAWVVRECPGVPPPGGGGAPGGGAAGGAMCGGIAGATCPPNQFCDYPRDARCGAGDMTGSCRPVPEACAEVYQPVCGCDGRTYGNECDANRAGVSVASEGECASAGGPGGSTEPGSASGERACGSRGLAPCGEGEFCDWPPSAQCGSTDAPGVCRPRPRMCTREYNPVCGCDGQTHSTRCTANSQGVSVAHDGPC